MKWEQKLVLTGLSYHNVRNDRARVTFMTCKLAMGEFGEADCLLCQSWKNGARVMENHGILLLETSGNPDNGPVRKGVIGVG